MELSDLLHPESFAGTLLVGSAAIIVGDFVVRKGVNYLAAMASSALGGYFVYGKGLQIDHMEKGVSKALERDHKVYK